MNPTIFMLALDSFPVHRAVVERLRLPDHFHEHLDPRHRMEKEKFWRRVGRAMQTKEFRHGFLTGMLTLATGTCWLTPVDVHVYLDPPFFGNVRLGSEVKTASRDLLDEPVSFSKLPGFRLLRVGNGGERRYETRLFVPPIPWREEVETVRVSSVVTLDSILAVGDPDTAEVGVLRLVERVSDTLSECVTLIPKTFWLGGDPFRILKLSATSSPAGASQLTYYKGDSNYDTLEMLWQDGRWIWKNTGTPELKYADWTWARMEATLSGTRERPRVSTEYSGEGVSQDHLDCRLPDI